MVLQALLSGMSRWTTHGGRFLEAWDSAALEFHVEQISSFVHLKMIRR
jgi:hypothetical protein